MEKTEQILHFNMCKYNHVCREQEWCFIIQMVLIQLMCPSASWRSMGWHGSSAAWYFDEHAPRMDMMAKLSLHLIQWIVLLYSVLLFSLIMAASLL